MSSKTPQQKKETRKVKKAVAREVAKEFVKGAPKNVALANRPAQKKAAQKATPAMKNYYRQFAHRDAHKLAWMACVADPWEAPAVGIPLSLTPGASPSTPRCFRADLRGIMVTNAATRGFIGANADAWMANPTSLAGTPAVPYNMYLGNSTAFSGARGYPVHYCSGGWIGNGAGTSGLSYPSPIVAQATGVAGLGFIQLPDKFINLQNDCSPTSGNAQQRFNNVSVGLRCRPIAPASGALEMAGVVYAVQQILGDTAQTNPAAANATTAVGGIDAVAYIAGMVASGAGAPPAGFTPLNSEQVAVTSWDVAKWPRVNNGQGEFSWMEITAIPCQSCAFGAWTPGNTGASVVGYPQVAFLTIGSPAGQLFEFEATYVYAWYGGVSYEVGTGQNAPRVGSADAASVLVAGSRHLRGPSQRAKAAVAAVAQEALDTGVVSSASSAASWIQSGSNLVKEITGQSIGDLIGEGLGFLSAMLL